MTCSHDRVDKIEFADGDGLCGSCLSVALIECLVVLEALITSGECTLDQVSALSLEMKGAILEAAKHGREALAR